MKIRFWGVRGSLASPLTPDEVDQRIASALREFLGQGHRDVADIERFLSEGSVSRFGGYGGNTPCLEVRTERAQIIIDGGTGIRPLGREMLRGPCGKGRGVVHLFLTHFHWDHLMGLPFFTPLFIEGNEVHFHAVQEDLPEAIRTVFRRPYFPVAFESLGARIHFHRLEPRTPVRIEDIEITPYQLDHPDPCWGYRFVHEGKAFAHCVDSETTRFTPDQLGPDLPLYQNLDLLVFDGQYTLMESILKETWGHGSALVGLDLARRERIPRVIFMHHDPAASDEKIRTLETETRRYQEIQRRQNQRAGEAPFEVQWTFAREGTEITL